jgi:hypothetical protein
MSYPTIASTIHDPTWIWSGQAKEYRDFLDTFQQLTKAAGCHYILAQDYHAPQHPGNHSTPAARASYRKDLLYQNKAVDQCQTILVGMLGPVPRMAIQPTLDNNLMEPLLRLLLCVQHFADNHGGNIEAARGSVLHTMNQLPNPRNFSEAVNMITSILCLNRKLQSLGVAKTPAELKTCVLEKLRSTVFDSFISSLPDAQTLPEIYGRLQDLALRAENQTPAVLPPVLSSILPSPSLSAVSSSGAAPTTRFACYNCGIAGHRMADCGILACRKCSKFFQSYDDQTYHVPGSCAPVPAKRKFSDMNASSYLSDGRGRGAPTGRGYQARGGRGRGFPGRGRINQVTVDDYVLDDEMYAPTAAEEDVDPYDHVEYTYE